MKSKIIALVIAGTTMLGTVSASAAVRYCNTNNGGYRHYWTNHCNKPCNPSKGEKPSTGEDNIVTPPTTGDDTIVTPPSSDDNTVITPPTEGDTITDNNANASDKFMAQVEQAIFNKVNEERAKAGVAPLSYNTTMEKYARIKSQDMGDNNYFSHTDLSGNYITAKMKADGVSYNSWGENIAYLGGYGTDPTVLANQFMTNWMNSSGHRKNILSTDFTSIGVGVYQIGNKVYATQEFYR